MCMLRSESSHNTCSCEKHEMRLGRQVEVFYPLNFLLSYHYRDVLERSANKARMASLRRRGLHQLRIVFREKPLHVLLSCHVETTLISELNSLPSRCPASNEIGHAS
jgi:hypothetical protein